MSADTPSNAIKRLADAQEIPQKRAKGAPRGNGNARKHNYYALKPWLKDAGSNAIDRRTLLGRELAERREAVERDAGGREQLSQLRQDLNERYQRTLVLIDSIDAYLFQQPSLVNRRKKSLLPIVQQRIQLVDSALRLAQAIGLDKKPPKPKTLQQVFEERERERAVAGTPVHSPVVAGKEQEQQSSQVVPFTPVVSPVQESATVEDMEAESGVEVSVPQPRTWRDRLELRRQSQRDQDTSFEETTE